MHISASAILVAVEFHGRRIEQTVPIFSGYGRPDRGSMLQTDALGLCVGFSEPQSPRLPLQCRIPYSLQMHHLTTKTHPTFHGLKTVKMYFNFSSYSYQLKHLLMLSKGKDSIGFLVVKSKSSNCQKTLLPCKRQNTSRRESCLCATLKQTCDETLKYTIAEI